MLGGGDGDVGNSRYLAWFLHQGSLEDFVDVDDGVESLGVVGRSGSWNDGPEEGWVDQEVEVLDYDALGHW